VALLPGRGATLRLSGHGNTATEATPDQAFYAREYAPRITQSGKRGRHESRLLEPVWVSADRLGEHDPSSAYSLMYSGFGWATPLELPRYWMRLPGTLGVDAAAPAFFYMIGRWLGDGWIHKRKTRQDTVRICANLEEAGHLALLLQQTGLTWHQARHTKSVDVFDLCAESSRLLIRWLVSHFGQYANGKTLPAWVFGASEDQRWALIAGYCDSDGHEQTNGMTATASVSRLLSVGVRLLLQSLGVAASLSKRDACIQAMPGRSEGMNCQAAYSVTWRKEVQWEKCHRLELHLWGRMRDVDPGQESADIVSVGVAVDQSLIADGQVARADQVPA
jgi:hypothetical protein